MGIAASTDWDLAGCRGMDPADFFNGQPPGKRARAQTAQAVREACLACPITEACLELATRCESLAGVAAHRFGTFGGRLPHQRESILST